MAAKKIVSVEPHIFTVRDRRVMLDSELAELYGVETRQLNRGVKRNRERFPTDFMFQLTAEELVALKCQFGTSKVERGGRRRSRPYAFTQEGVAMLSSVLRSARAVEVNIAIMRAFVRLRQMALSIDELARRVEDLERGFREHGQDIHEIFDALRELMNPPEPPRPEIGFHVREESARYRTKPRRRARKPERREIVPLRKEDAFLRDLEQPEAGPGELRIWWLGQSGFLVRYGGERLLLDPYLSDSLTKKYAGTDKPHVRMTERVIAPERLSNIGVVTSSHNHTDHLDPETLGPLLRANPQARLVIPEANRAFVAERLEISPSVLIGLDDGATVEVEGWQFTGIAAAHNELERDASGHHKYLGYVVRREGWTVYHSGDTLWYPGLVEKLRAFSIDVALLPINGSHPERRVAGNFDGREAAQLAHAIRARGVIPCHYDMFEFNTASPDGFIAECQRLGQSFCVLREGESWSPR